ncbi:hypothetical protein SCAR479_04690 [Seiridium cardinale]|uniref:Cyclase n=1 Tax=Seiridium cardinale TaxID=138064 RepID=A0ABR2XWV2_9PEZI
MHGATPEYGEATGQNPLEPDHCYIRQLYCDHTRAVKHGQLRRSTRLRLPPARGSDKNGKKDTLGCLNLLTQDTVKRTYAEARDGISISLNAPLDLLKIPGGPRVLTSHKVLSWAEDISPSTCGHMKVLDDEVTFNTQSSSQWDGLCHFAHQASGLGYNGFEHGKAGLEDTQQKRADLPGLEHWHERGGVVGRGVLLDYRAYADAKGTVYEPFSRHVITTEDLETVAEFQGTELRRGDILVVRAGAAEALDDLTGEEQLGLMMKSQGGMVGVEGNEKTAKKPDGSLGDMDDLALFGMNIGELWDLKALSQYCAKTNRYSFLLTSIPLKVPGLVASPPNALALF